LCDKLSLLKEFQIALRGIHSGDFGTKSVIMVKPNFFRKCLPLVFVASTITCSAALASNTSSWELGLFQQAALKHANSNVVLSPLSLKFGLAMAKEGAKGNTLSSLSAVVPEGWTGSQESLAGAQINIANSAWLKPELKFNPDYVQSIQRKFSAETGDLSLSAINAWVGQKTQGLIKNVLNELDPSALLVLVNTLYMNGEWAIPFNNCHDLENQCRGQFSVSETKKVEAPLMFNHWRFKYAENTEAQWLELPYSNSTLAMDLGLPADKNTLANLENSLSAAKLDQILADLKDEDVEVFLPKTTLNSQGSLLPLLRALLSAKQLDSSFLGGNADFSAMVTSDRGASVPLEISDIIQATEIKVGELGTEATAATAVIMAPGAAAPNPKRKIFEATHPYLFLIRNTQTGEILFSGHVVDPTQN